MVFALKRSRELQWIREAVQDAREHFPIPHAAAPDSRLTEIPAQ
jgi:hypothetical protein